jgi:hypothetical protein
LEPGVDDSEEELEDAFEDVCEDPDSFCSTSFNPAAAEPSVDT